MSAKEKITDNSGNNIVLTIDRNVQYITEKVLEETVTKFSAKSAIAIVMIPRTGAILAMAHYDPNEKNRDKPLKLKVVTDQFEPGSIFKVFTAGGLLDANLIDFDDTTYCEMGKWKLGRRILHDDKELEWLTFREIIELFHLFDE